MRLRKFEKAESKIAVVGKQFVAAGYQNRYVRKSIMVANLSNKN